MKVIINGVKYDTSTATCIGVYSYGYGSSRNYMREELYQKKTGSFFLYCEGGPDSPYAVQFVDYNFRSGSIFIPISEEEARDWAERHSSVKNYEIVFGVVEE